MTLQWRSVPLHCTWFCVIFIVATATINKAKISSQPKIRNDLSWLCIIWNTDTFKHPGASFHLVTVRNLYICHFTVATGRDIRKWPFGDISIDFLRALSWNCFTTLWEFDSKAELVLKVKKWINNCLTFWHRSFTFNSNKSPTWCNNFSVYYPDVCLHVSGVFPPIIRSSMTAVAVSGFTFVSWW